jgi:broad specificity phosphatase PhoE
MKRLLLAVAAATLLSAAPAAAQTVILVRHAEKADQSSDPMLSAAGQDRAQALALALSGARLTHVLVTPLQRTALTAGPAARAAGLTPEAMSFDGSPGDHIARFRERVQQLSSEDTVLVVGHSNTVPLIARQLGFSAAADMADCEYDRITVLDLREAGDTPAVVSRYGAPSTCG